MLGREGESSFKMDTALPHVNDEKDLFTAEFNSPHTITILSQIINCSGNEEVSSSEQDTALDNYVKLFVSISLSDHIAVLVPYVELLKSKPSGESLQIQCKLCDTLGRLVIGNEPGIKYGKWKEIVANELTSEAINIFKVIETLMLMPTSNLTLGNERLAACINLIATILNCNPYAKKSFDEVLGVNKLKADLMLYDTMNSKVGSALLDLLTVLNSSDTSVTERVFTMSDLVTVAIQLIPLFDSQAQRLLTESIRIMCASIPQNRLVCCHIGLISDILKLLEKHGKKLSDNVTDCLISVMEILGCLSISPEEVKLLISLFQNQTEGNRFAHADRLVQSLERMASQNVLFRTQYQPQYFINFFNVYSPTSIKCPSIHYWSGKGITVHTWICMDFTLPNTYKSRKNKLRHVLYCFLNPLGEGFEAFFTESGQLVLAVHTKKEYLTTTVTSRFVDQEWHSVTIVHTRKLLGRAIVTVYVDGLELHTAQLKYPAFNKEISHSYIGHGVKSDSNFHYQIHPSFYPTKVENESEYPESIAAGQQNQTWGIPSVLKGQMASFMLFSESLAVEKIRELSGPGPNYKHLFTPKHVLSEGHSGDTASLLFNVVFYFDAKASCGDEIIDLNPVYKDKFISKQNLTGGIHRVWSIQESIQSLGGIGVLFPLLEQACFHRRLKLDQFLDFLDGKAESIKEESEEHLPNGNHIKSIQNIDSNNVNNNDDKNVDIAVEVFDNDSEVKKVFDKRSLSLDLKYDSTSDLTNGKTCNGNDGDVYSNSSSQNDLSEKASLINGDTDNIDNASIVEFSEKNQSNNFPDTNNGISPSDELSPSHISKNTFKAPSKESITSDDVLPIIPNKKQVIYNKKDSLTSFSSIIENNSETTVREKKSSISDWTLVDATSPLTRSDTFKSWAKQDNHDLNGVTHFISLIRYMIGSHHSREVFVDLQGIKVIGLLLQSCSPNLINVGFLDSVAKLVESIIEIKDDLLKAIFKYIVFEFEIWYKADVSVQIAHTQLLHTYIKDDPELFRNLFGVDFFFRIIELYYCKSNEDFKRRTAVLSQSEARDLRKALLGLIFYMIKLSPKTESLNSVISYMANLSQHEHLDEVLDLLHNIVKIGDTALNSYAAEIGTHIMYRWSVYEIPDHIRLKISNIVIHLLHHGNLPDSMRQKLLLKPNLFPAIGELLRKQDINRDIVIHLLKLGISLDRSIEQESDIYSDFNIVLSVVRVVQCLPRPIKLEVAIKIRNSLKLSNMSAERCANELNWYEPLWRLILTENNSPSDMDVMEAELVQVVIEIIYIVMWTGIIGSDESAWVKRCEPLCSLHNLSSANYTFLLPVLVVERQLLEMCLQASSTALNNSEKTYAVDLQNASRILKLVEDFIFSSELEGKESSKWSVKLISNVLVLLDAMNAWEDSTEAGSEWLEVLQIAERILYNCCLQDENDVVIAGSQQLAVLLAKHTVKSKEEACYQMFHLNDVLKSMKEKGLYISDHLMNSIYLRYEVYCAASKEDEALYQLPPFKQAHFNQDFLEYMESDDYQLFSESIWPISKKYSRESSNESSLDIGRLWMDSLNSMSKSLQQKEMDVEESLQNFSKTIYLGFDEKRNEERTSFEDYKKLCRQQKGITKKLWQYQKHFLTSERGAWKSLGNPSRHFKLSNAENRYRMRLKLTENLAYNSHSDASRQRDMKSLPDVVVKKIPVILPVSANIGDNVMEEDKLLSPTAEYDNDSGDIDQVTESSHLYDLQTFEKITGSCIHYCECTLVTLMDVIAGRIELTETHVCYYDDKENSPDSTNDFNFALDELREIHSRRYNLRKTAMEFFLLDRSSFLVNFPSAKEKDLFYRKLIGQKPKHLYFSGIQTPSKLLRVSKLTSKWVEREISNFEYLMQLNTISGRTYNDLAQYPVFPWVLIDYSSETLNLEDESIYRDLSKPVGILNPKKEEEIKSRYESFIDPSGMTQKSHYFTHYSNPGGVLHYMVRVEPFTSLHIHLQGGKFDCADRLFYSLQTSWESVMNSSDVMELTPEFYYFPEFLINLNGFNLGELQNTGSDISNVRLPPWAKDAYDFVQKHRKALESEYVSANLHSWIDLIFGFKQRGKEAEKALNVFSHYSYEGAVDLDMIDDPVLREATEGMINNFGQTPTQLLKKPHPRRKTLKEMEAGKPIVTNDLEASTYSLIEIMHMVNPLIFIAACKPRPKSILYQAVPDSLITVHVNGLFGTHSWYTDPKTNKFSFTMDVLLASASSHSQRVLPGAISPSLDYSSRLFAFTADGHLMISCGYWDNSIRLVNTDRGKDRLKMCVNHHNDIVTCIALDIDGSHLISGSADLTCAIWKIEQVNGFSAGLSPKPIQILYGHNSSISAIGMHGDLDLAVSGAQDGTCLIHTIRRGIFLHTLNPSHAEDDEAPSTVIQIKISEQGRIIILSNLVGYDVPQHFISMYSINGSPLGNVVLNQLVCDICIVNEYLVIGSMSGTLQIRHTNDLNDIVLSKNVKAPIFTVASTYNGSHIFIGRGDGNILVMCPSDL